MASDRRIRRFMRQWRKRYPYPVAWADERANKQCRRSEGEWLAQFEGATDLRRRQVTMLVEWRFADAPVPRHHALQGIAGPAAWGHARRRIKKALAASSPTAALDLLVADEGGVPGWGPEMASVVLAACRPDLYTIADHRALRTLQALKLHLPRSEEEFARLDWWPYLTVCRRLTDVCGLSLRSVHHALRAAADEAPNLPEPPERRHRPPRPR
jgi:hypothetical protein